MDDIDIMIEHAGEIGKDPKTWQSCDLAGFARKLKYKKYAAYTPEAEPDDGDSVGECWKGED